MQTPGTALACLFVIPAAVHGQQPEPRLAAPRIVEFTSQEQDVLGEREEVYQVEIELSRPTPDCAPRGSELWVSIVFDKDQHVEFFTDENGNPFFFPGDDADTKGYDTNAFLLTDNDVVAVKYEIRAIHVDVPFNYVYAIASVRSSQGGGRRIVCLSPQSNVVARPRSPGPDLTVTAGRVTRTSDNTRPYKNRLAPDEGFRVSFVVRNVGEGVSRETRLRYYYEGLSGWQPVNRSDELPRIAAPHPPRPFPTYVRRFLPRSESRSGVHAYRACIDSVHLEVNTGNNCSEAVVIAVGLPDLTVQLAAPDVTSHPESRILSIAPKIVNIGIGAVDGFFITYWVPGAATAELEPRGTVRVESSPDGAFQAFNLLQVPRRPGTFRIQACVSTNQDEVFTNNNCATKRITVTGTSGPDLVVGRPLISNDILTPGQSFTLAATVRNQGSVAAGASTITYHRSIYPTILAVDRRLGSGSVMGLAPGAATSVTATANAPTTPGTYYFGACVQGQDEIDTGNNCSTGVRARVGRGIAFFTDDPILPGATRIKAVHIQELRGRIATLRARESLPGMRWSDPALTAGVTSVRRVHLTEMRAALGAVYDAVAQPRPLYTDPVLSGRAIKAVHIMQLRDAIEFLE